MVCAAWKATSLLSYHQIVCFSSFWRNAVDIFTTSANNFVRIFGGLSCPHAGTVAIYYLALMGRFLWQYLGRSAMAAKDMVAYTWMCGKA